MDTQAHTPLKRREWDGEAKTLIDIVNEMLVESGITDRRFYAQKLNDDRTKIGMQFGV